MNGLEKAIKKAGNASNLAALLGIKPMSVTKMTLTSGIHASQNYGEKRDK